MLEVFGRMPVGPAFQMHVDCPHELQSWALRIAGHKESLQMFGRLLISSQTCISSHWGGAGVGHNDMGRETHVTPSAVHSHCVSLNAQIVLGSESYGKWLFTTDWIWTRKAVLHRQERVLMLIPTGLLRSFATSHTILEHVPKLRDRFF